MLLRDELEELRMVAQKTQAKINADPNVVGRVLVKPELILELINAYEQVLAAEANFEPLTVVEPLERFKW